MQKRQQGFACVGLDIPGNRGKSRPRNTFIDSTRSDLEARTRASYADADGATKYSIN